MQKTGIIERKVHFIGIGGISMSGLAMILMTWGIPVSGSDRTDSDLIERLRRMGAEIHIGHRAGQHGDASLVVYTPAVAEDNEELAAARESHVPVIRRDELLGRIIRQYRQSVGVSGVHGKTTCTSMTATILYKCGKDPTVHLGGSLDLLGGSVRVGSNGIFVTEACEYKESFLAFPPTIAVILNIDADHLDYFRDIDAVADAFRKYVSLLPKDGYCIVNGEDARAVEILKNAPCPGTTFGMAEGCFWRAANVMADASGRFSFDLIINGEPCCRAFLSVPGRHNVYNALAAIAAACRCGVDPRCATVYHDYAHHPAEIRATLEAAALLPRNRLWCVFQPHTYTRTKALFNDFVTAFGKADKTVMLDIYAAREKDPGDISARMLCDAINEKQGKGRCVYAPSFEEAAKIVKKGRRPGDIIFTVGAGDIEQINEMLL
jgi:UDP-N-acetylmuramate--alanine ligase